MALDIKPFKEIIAMSKEKIDEAMAPIRAKTVRYEALQKMNEIEGQIVKLQSEVQELVINPKIDFDRLIDKLDDIKLLEHRRISYQEVLDQLFPERKKASK